MSAPSAALSQRISYELLRQLHAAHAHSGVGALTVVTLFWVLFYWQLRDRWVLAWALLLYLNVAVVFIWYARFGVDARRPVPRPPAYWLRRFHAVQAFAGLSWGIAPWLFAAQDNLPVNAVLVVAVMGLASASQGTLSFVRHGMTSFALPMMLCLAVALLRQPDPLHGVLAFFVLLHLLLSIKLSSDHHRLMVEALRARFDNEALAERLGAQVVATERASQEKTRFLATASHDLRQPLHALALMGSALRERLARQGHPEARQAGEMMRAVDALGSSLDALLDVSRLDAGVVVAERVPVALQGVFLELQRRFEASASVRELALRVRATPVCVRADAQLLLRLLSNLVDNALKYTPCGGVLVAARKRGEHVWVDVVDTGIGIAPEHAALVFDEFYQVGNPGRDRTLGLGIGLSIVRRLAELMGLSVRLHSRPGCGSRFRVVLPLVEVAPVFEPVSDAPSRVSGPAPRVLVLDDEAGIRHAMLDLLRTHGIDAEAVADETAAEAALRGAQMGGQPFRVLLLDYRLAHGADGLQVAQRLRQTFAPSPALLLVTGETAPERLREVQRLGIPVLYKPVQAERLLATIGSLRAIEK